MKLNLPNRITIARLLLAMVFFLLLSFPGTAWADAAEVVFVVACLTDIFDGYFARRYKQVTVFGRIADPFVDKIIVCGGFALLADPNGFIEPWMVVVVVSREFVVSGIRAYAEGRGIAFGAELAGKLKAAVQMCAVAFALYYRTHGQLPYLPPPVSAYVVIVTLYLAILATVGSVLMYVVKARKLFAGPE